MAIVLMHARLYRSLGLIALLAALGCHAQTPAPAQAAGKQVQVGVPLTPEMSRRVEVMIRSRSQITPDYTMQVGTPTASDIAGYDQVMVTFTADGGSPKSSPFLISTDGKTLAQFNKLDISEDPKDKVSAAGRPARGGPENAPVLIVGFDDLECPYCARMNAELFPAILDRYKNQVRVVYRDFPLDQHPWAMHAAVDANCLASVSSAGYWNFVDYVHAHAADIAGDEKTVAKADQSLDKLVLDEGVRQKVDQAQLTACVLKQDDSKVKESAHAALAQPLSVDSTPILFINGEKVEGVVPIETIFRVIDQALIASGQTPPPTSPAKPAPAATKPGS
jgi:protein-disulfide isomerase